jgi:hypothetical protein
VPDDFTVVGRFQPGTDDDPHEAAVLVGAGVNGPKFPTVENIDRMRRVMEVAAERFRCEHHGWEAAVQRRGR